MYERNKNDFMNEHDPVPQFNHFQKQISFELILF